MPLNGEDFKEIPNVQVKEESPSSYNDELGFAIRQRGQRINGPRRTKKAKIKCQRVIDDLVKAMKPITGVSENPEQTFWFFGKHVTERLNSMRQEDAESASQDIIKVLEEFLPGVCLLDHNAVT